MTEPALHRDIPFATYCDWPGINGDPYRFRDPLHFDACVKGLMPREDSDAMRFGRGVHCYVLERDEFESRYPIAKPFCTPLKTGENKGKPCGKQGYYRLAWPDGAGADWFCGVHKVDAADEVKDYATADEVKQYEAIRQALHRSAFVNQFKRPGWSEVSGTFTEAGFTLKFRLDRYCEAMKGAKGSSLYAQAMILDLKKCQVGKIDTASCQKAITNYGYYRKAAVYTIGVEKITGTRPNFAWVFVEDGPPHDVNVIFADDNDIRIGWGEVTTALQGYRWALEHNNLYGTMGPKGTDIQRGGLTEWKLRQNL